MPPTFATRIDIWEGVLRIVCEGSAVEQAGRVVYVALGTSPLTGSAVVPFQQGAEGSTVFLPFRAEQLYFAELTSAAPIVRRRIFAGTMWSAHLPAGAECVASVEAGVVQISMRMRDFGEATPLAVAVYAKDLRENDGWGRMLGAVDGSVSAGLGDRYIRSYYRVDGAVERVEFVRHRIAAERIRIYQLLPRLFGNLNETRQANGSLAQNGVGKFGDINDAAIRSIKSMGFTHVWLTGVLRHVTGTDYSQIGLPADDADLLKGLAGSPYAIKDYFDVCPDFAEKPAERIKEFTALVVRLHAAGLRVLIDFVANHVARSYASTVRPELSFGAQDDRTILFDPRNNFFYLHGSGGLRLPTWKDGEALSPTCKILGTCDGQFDGERDHARVTGNDVASAEPKLHDWYETVKLNYGYDFTSRAREYPHGAEREKAIPDTWTKMDRVLAYWQELGVDGFRCDMAHMVPPEFWAWAIGRASARQPEVFFVAEAYDDDPMKVPAGDPLLAGLNDGRGNVMFDLLSAGFGAVYDHPSYRKLKTIYDGPCWANDLDAVFGHDFAFHNSLRYAENHDEVRLAGRDHWGKIGMNVGRPVAAILYGISRGPLLLYSGQEIGEPAHDAEGFGGDDARTTIFDYWSMPELTKWVNGHRYDGAQLSAEQHDLREFYARLLHLVGEPAFSTGEFFGLNAANCDNPHFGRLPGETASGHWLYAFLRHDAGSGQRFFVIANLHRAETMRDVRVRMPAQALEFLALRDEAKGRFRERLYPEKNHEIAFAASAGEVCIGDLAPLTPYYFELQIDRP
jgi:glycosidase